MDGDCAEPGGSDTVGRMEAVVAIDSQSAIKRGERGKFLPGTKGGPGRPPGAVDVYRVAKKRAKQEGTDLREMVWEVMREMHAAATIDHDASAAKLFLDRACGPVEKAPEVQVNVAAAIQAGPPAPAEPRELGAYLARLNEIAAQQGLLKAEEGAK